MLVDCSKEVDSFNLAITPETVKDYYSGDYFGELALIKNELRAASIIAKVIKNNSD